MYLDWSLRRQPSPPDTLNYQGPNAITIITIRNPQV